MPFILKIFNIGINVNNGHRPSVFVLFLANCLCLRVWELLKFCHVLALRAIFSFYLPTFLWNFASMFVWRYISLKFCKYVRLTVCLVVCLLVCNFFDTCHSFSCIFTIPDPSMYFCHVTMHCLFDVSRDDVLVNWKWFENKISQCYSTTFFRKYFNINHIVAQCDLPVSFFCRA